MSTVIAIHDELSTGSKELAMNLEFESNQITAQDLIKERIYFEVEKHNHNTKEVFKGLVQPTGAEKVLNGFKIKEAKKIDAETQFYIACDAFKKNQFVLLVDDKQVSELNEDISLRETTTVSFLKLIPLVGG